MDVHGESYTYKTERELETIDQQEEWKAQKTLGREGDDRLNSSARGPVYEECSHNRANVSLEESVTERSRVGNAHAHLLH